MREASALGDSRERSAALADSLLQELADIRRALAARRQQRAQREQAAAKLAALQQQLAEYRNQLLVAPRAVKQEARDARFTMMEGEAREAARGDCLPGYAHVEGHLRQRCPLQPCTP